VRVPNARLAVAQTVYAMANVTSVSTRKHYGLAPLALIVGVVLVVVALSTAAGPERGDLGFPGALLLLIGALRTARPKYHLRISTSAGEVSALSSKEKEHIERVAHAIQEAMIHRR